MTWTRQFQLGDPAIVYERMETHAHRQAKKAIRKAQNPFEDDMTEDQSTQIEELLMLWYEHTLSYRPRLGAPGVSAYAKDYRTSETKRSDSDLRDDADDKLDKIKADSVEACVDSLPVLQKSAVEMHCRAKHSGASVIRNPRLTLEQHHEYYLAAKVALLPMFKRRELVR